MKSWDILPPSRCFAAVSPLVPLRFLHRKTLRGTTGTMVSPAGRCTLAIWGGTTSAANPGGGFKTHEQRGANRKGFFFSAEGYSAGASCWTTSGADFNYVALMSLPAKLIKSGFRYTKHGDRGLMGAVVLYTDGVCVCVCAPSCSLTDGASAVRTGTSSS